MKHLEKFSFIFLIAGFIFFLMAFAMLGLGPALLTSDMPADGGLPKKIPNNFKKYYNTVTDYQNALLLGKSIYMKEACWHCHSQYIRPTSNESSYYGVVSVPQEYENILNLPQLFGTRRVGPDLVRIAGKHTNDWHFAHLYDPKLVVPRSIMPSYSWYFTESQNTEQAPPPTKEAIALVAYLQNLGSWAKDAQRSSYDLNEIILPPEPD